MFRTVNYISVVIVAGLLAPLAAAQRVPCENGQAGSYSCENIDLLSHLSISEIDADFSQDTTTTTDVNDIWGWTDSETGKEYALVGRRNGVAVVDVSDPERPVYVANLPKHTPEIPCGSQRDVKVYENYAFVVAEVCPNGLQVFDLTRVREIQDPPVNLSETAFYGRFKDGHNVFINTETGYAYVVGISQEDDIPNSYPFPEQCGSGLHIVDVRVPADPQFAGCYLGSGYVHDVQCVIYRGPDPDYQGREICVSSSQSDLAIADVTNKIAPTRISSFTYPTAAYVHQGWFTEDQRYFIQDDEADERNNSVQKTTTYIWDFQDLDAPELILSFEWPTIAIDHNLYVVDSLVFASNYTSGLRVMDISEIQNPEQVAYFDTFPQSDAQVFDGSWSNYPFFESGIVIVSDISNGLFVVELNVEPDSTPPVPPEPPEPPEEPPTIPSQFQVSPASPNPFCVRTEIKLVADADQQVNVVVYDAIGRRVATLFDGSMAAGERRRLFFNPAPPLGGGGYWVRVKGEDFVETRAVVYVKQ